MRHSHRGVAFGTLFVLTLLVNLFLQPISVNAQAEILGISSFQECVNVDPSARNDVISDGVGQFLDCSTEEPGVTDTVTIMDLRLVAGSSGPEVFLIDLTTLRPINSSSQTSSKPGECSPDFSSDGSFIPTDCQLTNTTYAITIESTQYIYYYDLTYDETFDIPYCHVVQVSDTATQDCNKPVYEGPNTKWAKYTASCDARVQRINHCSGSGTTGSTMDNSLGDCAYWMDRFSTASIYEILTGNTTDGTPLTLEEQQEYYAAYNENDCTTNRGESRCIRTEFSSDILRKRDPPIYNPKPPSPNSWDDYSSAFLGETFLGATWTDHKLALPSPLPLGLDQSGTYNPGNGLQILNCLGDCAANKQNCYNGYGEPGSADALRSNGTLLQSGGVDVGMFALGPTCSIFRAQLSPQIAMVVTMSVVDTSRPMDPPTIVVTDNVRPGSQESDPLKQIGFEIISVGTLQNVLGPPLGGAFLVCGAERDAFTVGAEGKSFEFTPVFDLLNPPSGESNNEHTQFFPSMRTQMAPAEEVDNILYNPWENIKEQAAEDTVVYYPSDRYMSYNAVCDANDQTIVDGSGRQCIPASYMWYYIPPQDLHTIGRGCNQIGITDAFWNVGSNTGQNLVSQFASDVCASDPFICVPGFQTGIETQGIPKGEIEGFDSVTFVTDAAVTGCMASTAWEIAHETKGDDFLNLLYFRANQQSPGLTPPGPDANGVAGVLNTAEERFSSTVSQHIMTNNMPPGYTPESPNYWFQKESSTEYVDGYRIYYDPSETVREQVSLSFEMTVFFVGKFIAYGAVVPSGLIIQTGTCAPSEEFPTVTVFQVSVQNTGLTVGDYRMELTCPPSTLFEVVNPVQTFSNVPPGNISAPQTFELEPAEGTDGTVGSDACFLVLTSLNQFATLDQQPVDGCTIYVRDINATSPPAPPYAPPNHSNGTSCKPCDSDCWHEHGGMAGSICFWFIEIPIVIFILALGTAVVLYVYHRVKQGEQIKQGRDVMNLKNKEAKDRVNRLINK